MLSVIMSETDYKGLKDDLIFKKRVKSLNPYKEILHPLFRSRQGKKVIWKSEEDGKICSVVSASNQRAPFTATKIK